jgi:cyclophilin family peptidyl-prolyl cis-trans isomerase
LNDDGTRVSEERSPRDDRHEIRGDQDSILRRCGTAPCGKLHQSRQDGIQGGDPLSKTPDRALHGTGGPGYFLSPEPSDRPHKRGAVSMAKMPRESNSTRDFNDNGSQFFICVGENSGLDRRYTVFGEVFRGIEIVDKIVGVPRDERDNPLDPITITMTVKE